ncbi:carboxypeptidase-like regulatory domain-containing protein [Polaribacter sargassicola]|uniref:carboxypeptidase-like regulatory domain-containing protein n=1 Tax=Polaribacter sargassicola TaxID=2836891 RepID=UPI001F3F4F79|nr:carboxypeptidase-like regulatory domain-containing protein [Polaribacter sp. DS7-9]MCG1037053.1 hypothetical protein [Polaribacter sp. DS7-9]
MIKKLLLPFILILAFTTFAQNQKTLILGKLTDSIGPIKNANIINLKTNQGTFSLDDGTFNIHAKQGDTLQISSIQHKTQKFAITKEIISSRILKIKLNATTYILEEFELRKNNLVGTLTVDLNDVPKNRKDSLLRETMDFSNVNFNQKDYTIDAISKAKPPIVNTVPNSTPVGGASASIPFKDKESKLRKELAQKKAVPDKILSELGESFFFEVLKIPRDNYYHFLEYCNPLGIEDLHKENETLELIKIFQKESIPYLKIIKND